MTDKMNPEAKALWLQALRSAEYNQTRNAFTDKDAGGTVGHCCLAVLAHEAAKKDLPGIRWAEGAEEPEVVAVWDPEHYGWNQVDEAGSVMTDYPEIDYVGGATPVRESQRQWAWAPASEFNDGMLPEIVRHWAGLEADNPQIGDRRAAEWNDSAEASFTEIADLVEENL